MHVQLATKAALQILLLTVAHFSPAGLTDWGSSGGAKVSCISRHLGVHLILAYSWGRPTILVAG